MKIAVIGAGAFGTAMATIAARCDNEIVLWAHDPHVAEGIASTGKNPVYLEQPWFILIESADEEYPAAPPAEISQQKTKPTVEVASTGNSVPVPKGGKPPSPGKTKSVWSCSSVMRQRRNPMRPCAQRHNG